MKPTYSLNLRKILLSKFSNILIAFTLLLVLRLSPVKYIFFSNAVLLIIFFPLILGFGIFINHWFIQILDTLFLWVKTVNMGTKTIDKRIKFEDFYLLEYSYSVSESLKNRVLALLIITAEKKVKFKVLCEAECLDDAPDECREFAKYCQEQEKYMLAGNRRFPNRHKIIIGKKTYINWSFYQRIFIKNILWIASAILFCWLSFYLILEK